MTRRTKHFQTDPEKKFNMCTNIDACSFSFFFKCVCYSRKPEPHKAAVSSSPTPSCQPMPLSSFSPPLLLATTHSSTRPLLSLSLSLSPYLYMNSPSFPLPPQPKSLSYPILLQQRKMPLPPLFPFFLSLLLLPTLLYSASTYPYHASQQKQPLNLHQRTSASAGGGAAATLPDSKRYEGSSDLVHLRYHMGPVLSTPIRLYLIWYGRWTPALQAPIRDFILSLSDTSVPAPSAAKWWSTVSLYTDQTGSNVSRSLSIAAEASDLAASRGRSLTRLSVQQLIADALKASSFPVDHRRGVYLVLTAPEIAMQDFCRAVCGFHYFTFPSLVGHTLPYAWIGHSGAQCPDVCAYPFAVPSYMAGGGVAAMRPPNGDVGTDGMVSVVAHELAELSTNPLVNAWYAGEDPTAPTEIADLCEGVYGTGGGGGYTGQVSKDGQGRSYNINGRGGRRFLVQWVWSPVAKACVGPNALD